MWLFAMFDCPVETKIQRREAAKFRKYLLAEGFMMLQYSVYCRYCRTDDIASNHKTKMESHLPPEGEVRVFWVTDRQFGLMKVFFGRNLEDVEEAPKQLLLF